MGYFPPQDPDYGQPTVMADRGALHLETRYNYEGIDTGSAWVGWNFGVGEKLRPDATLMAGGVFGETKGVAPGYELTVSLGPFELYSEGEYVVDVEDSDNNFLYNWSQLSYSPLEWLSVGLVSQRTRTYETGLDVQRGFLVGLDAREPEPDRLRVQPGMGDAHGRHLGRRQLLVASRGRAPGRRRFSNRSMRLRLIEQYGRTDLQPHLGRR